MFLEVQVQDQTVSLVWTVGKGNMSEYTAGVRCQSRGSAHISCQDREKGKDEGNKIPFKATLLIIWRLNTRLCHLRILVISQYPLLGPSLYILAFEGKSSKTQHTGAIILVNCFCIFIHTDMRALNVHHRAPIYSCQSLVGMLRMNLGSVRSQKFLRSYSVYMKKKQLHYFSILTIPVVEIFGNQLKTNLRELISFQTPIKCLAFHNVLRRDKLIRQSQSGSHLCQP